MKKEPIVNPHPPTPQPTPTPVPSADASAFSPVPGSEETPSDPTSAAVPSFLQENLSEVDTSVPVLKGSQILDWKCTECKIEPNKKGDGQNLRAVLKTVSAGAETVDGKTVGEGFPFFYMCSLTPTKDYDEDAVKKNVAKFVQGFGKTHLFPLTQYVGAVCTAKTKVRGPRKNKDTGEEYPEATDLTFVPPGE